MSEADIMRELEKLKYHVKTLSHTIDSERFPVESLVLEMDWDENQLDRAHDIFEEYSNKIEAKEQITWHNFEMALRDEFNIGYQTVKSIVLAFYKNDQWVEVCKGYAMSFEPTTPVEFHRITRGDK
ncbi:MAG: YhaI family protein [Anaerolineae bacterium]|nr:YhaI family protein [Anaerolineae bacterium]